MFTTETIMTGSSNRSDSATSSCSVSSSSTSSSSSSSSAGSTTTGAAAAATSIPVLPLIVNHPQTVEQSSEEEEDETNEIECPSFIRDRMITRTLHEFELEDEEIPEPDYSWDAKTISHHLARYLDDLCGWVPDPKVQYRRVAPSTKKAKGMTKSDIEAQVRRLSLNSRMASRMKAMTIEFEFRHYHNPKKYMEQYRRFHTCGGPLERLAAQDTSYGRKRCIYYAGDAAAEAGIKVEPGLPKPTETRLTTAQLESAPSDGTRLSQSRQRQNSESRSEISNTDSTNSGAGSILPRAVSSHGPAVHNEQTSLPRYCSLTEAANRKRQVYSHWMGIPGSRIPGSAPKPTRDGHCAHSAHTPNKFTTTDDGTQLKPESATPTAAGSTAVAPSSGSRPTFHNPLLANPGATGDATGSLQYGSPPNGSHPLWKATQYPATTDHHTLPVAFGHVTRLSKNNLLKAIDEELCEYEDSGMAGNFSTGVTLDDSCYGYKNNGVMSSEGSAFRDFYSHLLQAAHYLRLAGRQKSVDNANKQMGAKHHTGPTLYKSAKTPTVTSPTNESITPDHNGLPTSIAITQGFGVRGQRLNSATNHQRPTHSAYPSLDPGASRQYVNASMFKASKARFNSSPPKASTDSDADSSNSRKRFISLEPPTSSTFRESTTRTALSDGTNRDEQKNKAGKMFHISIPNKPCKAEASQINKAAVCQAVCFKSESQEALAITNGNASKK